MKKKISLDLTPLTSKNWGGIEWYIYNLTKILCKNNKNEYVGEICNFHRKNLSKIKTFNLTLKEKNFFPSRIFIKLQRFISYNFLMNTKSNIYCFFNFYTPPKIKGKVIVTIHDVVFAECPETCENPKPLSEYEDSIKKSDIILTVSESSKKGILKYFNADSNKIRIVSPGIYLEDYNKIYSKEQYNIVMEKYELPDKFILYLGTIEPRKNIDRLILAFEKYKTINNNNLKLIIAGKKGWKYEKIFETYQNSKYKEDIRFIDYINEEDKILLYKLAKLFIFPSLYEGFGMPVLEAMAAGTPVITSNVSSLPEVAGKGAILVNPYSVEEIAEGINKIINGNKEFIKNLVNQGKEQAKKYTWEKSAEKLEKIYEEL